MPLLFPFHSNGATVADVCRIDALYIVGLILGTLPKFPQGQNPLKRPSH